MTGCCHNQFKSTSMNPEYHNPKVFVTSQWQNNKDKPSYVYLFIRLSIFITFLVIWTLTITMQTSAGRQKWPIYLTNWGLTLCLLQSCAVCILLIGAHIDESKRDGQINWKKTILKIYPLYWVLNIMATTVAFTITLVYWTLIYNAEGAYWSIMNFMVHGFNTILMLIDFWVVSHPVQIFHCVYPVAIALTYTTMTFLFYILGGTTPDGSKYIYPILKWDEPGSTLLYCLMIVLLMVIIHILTYLMYITRSTIALIYRKLTCRDRSTHSV